jgi:hypothetical protein
MKARKRNLVFCVLANIILQRIFEPRREVLGEWWQLHNKELIICALH